MTQRTLWYARSLAIEDEPLMKTLIRYRQHKNRKLTSLTPSIQGGQYGFANLVASITTDGKQMPILDLDFPHHFEPSTTPGHTHFYIDVPMSKWRWFWLMTALAYAGVIEKPFYAWSLRRGGNFVRIPNTFKVTEEETRHSNYGWFRRLKDGH